MEIPSSNRKKALIIVDVQPGFLKKRNKYIIKNIQKLLQSVKYDIYVESIFHAEKTLCGINKKDGFYQKIKTLTQSHKYLGICQVKQFM